jgi:hypothetical protein
VLQASRSNVRHSMSLSHPAGLWLATSLRLVFDTAAARLDPPGRYAPRQAWDSPEEFCLTPRGLMDAILSWIPRGNLLS